MVQPGYGGLDTPRTQADATYLSNQQLDFDISQEQSFQSPSKDNNNLIQQLQNGRRGAINLKTPRSRAALGDRRNLPVGLGGGEFTPLLKSATRNSALRIGKENVPQTPAFLKPGGLDNIAEDLTPLPNNSSMYGDSRNGSYFAGTPMPQVESSSAASTPMVLLPRRNEGPGVLQDGNQLSLREQENVIDKIEKENFGLKLKIHFLEEALRKSGPGFSEAALKENTELKVDKVTMQKELSRYRKTLASAENDVELYRQQFNEMQEKVKRKHLDQDQREELERLRQSLEERDSEINRLRSRENLLEDMQDKLNDLEADLREKDRLLDDREDDVENLKDEIEKRDGTISELKKAVKDSEHRAAELEEKAQASEELDDAKETIEELEQEMKRLKEEADDAKEERQDALREKERAEADLEELQDEMANKSITTKGLSRQIEEKANRLQDELEELREKHATLEAKHAERLRDIEKLLGKMDEAKQESEVKEQKLKDRLEIVQNEKDVSSRENESLSKRFASIQRENENSTREKDSLVKRLESCQEDIRQITDEKNLLQIRHDALTTESASLQRELSKSRKTIEDLEDQLNHEKTLALNNEREVRDQYKGEIDRLHDEIEDLRAEMREKERMYDDDNDKWESERRNLESQRQVAEEKAVGLQRTIDKLQQAEGTLSSKESKLQQALQTEKDRHQNQEALLNRQISELNEDVETRRKALEEVRSEMTSVREELRLSQREQKSLAEKIEGLEDEVEILQNSLDDESEQANRDINTAKQESEALRRQIQTLKQGLARAEAAASEARAEIEAFQGDIQAGEGSKEQLGSRLREVEAQLSRVRQDRQTSQDQLASLNLELHSLRSSKADIEAERDEIKSQLRSLKQQEEETYRLDQERMDLRTAKMKLDGEVRRLREENKMVTARQEALEKELQDEIDRATAEEARLKTEIHDLQKIMRGSSEKKELASAKKTIQQLEERIHDLESQIAVGGGDIDTANELSMIRRDLSAARQKETEFLQREASQKEQVRSLKRQITDLERKAHDAEISRLIVSSPHSSINSSARKSEIIEVRAQLATAHQTLREIRSQLKESEKESHRKLNALNIEIEAKTVQWESEKDELERALDEAVFEKEELSAKNTSSEATISRLRGKIDRLEKALQAERLNGGEDRSIVQERRDLHEMLRETRLEAESLEVLVQERDNKIAAISSVEAELRSHLKRVRDERRVQRSKATAASEQLAALEIKYKEAKENWEVEKRNLTRGVRFPNMSVSYAEDADAAALKTQLEEAQKQHVREIRGMNMQIEWLRAKCKREADFRDDAAYAKLYMQLRIDMYDACNKADIRLLESCGIERPSKRRPPPPKNVRKIFRGAVFMIRATVRMKKGALAWQEKLKIHERIVEKIREMKLQAMARKTITSGY